VGDPVADVADVLVHLAKPRGDARGRGSSLLPLFVAACFGADPGDRRGRIAPHYAIAALTKGASLLRGRDRGNRSRLEEAVREAEAAIAGRLPFLAAG